MTNRYKNSIIALDTATKTGYAIYNNGKIIKSGTWKFSEKEREKELFLRLKRTIEKYSVAMIVAEDVFKGKKSAYDVLCELRGIVRAVAQIYKLPEIEYIPPVRAQIFMWGRRCGKDYKRTEKQKMIEAVTKLGYQLEKPMADDEADAIGILLTYLYSKGLPVTHPNGKRQ